MNHLWQHPSLVNSAVTVEIVMQPAVVQYQWWMEMVTFSRVPSSPQWLLMNSPSSHSHSMNLHLSWVIINFIMTQWDTMLHCISISNNLLWTPLNHAVHVSINWRRCVLISENIIIISVTHQLDICVLTREVSIFQRSLIERFKQFQWKYGPVW